ncbi:MAG: hypothetical protein QME81_19015, partial [bacterium]|nr:hypothetical protein [bacterium]
MASTEINLADYLADNRISPFIEREAPPGDFPRSLFGKPTEEQLDRWEKSPEEPSTEGVYHPSDFKPRLPGEQVESNTSAIRNPQSEIEDLPGEDFEPELAGEEAEAETDPQSAIRNPKSAIENLPGKDFEPELIEEAEAETDPQSAIRNPKSA